MSTLRLAGPILGLLLLAALSALASPRENVLDGADSQELLIVQAATAPRVESALVASLRSERLAAIDHAGKTRAIGIVPFTGENIPEVGQ